MMRWSIQIVASVLCALCVAFPARGDDYFPKREWRTSRPADQGLDGRALGRLVDRIGAGDYGRLHSLQIVRNGYLVVDEYFNGSGPEVLHTLQSDTKSITSLLVGIAVGQGKIGAVGDPV